jgi:hypothetical protein
MECTNPLAEGIYSPSPVHRVEIPKPNQIAKEKGNWETLP